MCIYTLKKQKRLEIPQTELLKIRRLRRKGNRKNEQRFKHVMLHTGRL